MPYSKCPNGTAGGRFTGYAASWWHNSFNLHYFRPYFLWQISFLQFRPNLRFRFLSSNSPSFSLQRRKSPQTRPQGQFNNQQSHFNKCCNSRKKDTIYLLFFLLNISPTFPAFDPHSRIIFLLLITWCKIGVVFLD